MLQHFPLLAYCLHTLSSGINSSNHKNYFLRNVFRILVDYTFFFFSYKFLRTFVLVLGMARLGSLLRKLLSFLLDLLKLRRIDTRLYSIALFVSFSLHQLLASEYRYSQILSLLHQVSTHKMSLAYFIPSLPFKFPFVSIIHDFYFFNCE